MQDHRATGCRDESHIFVYNIFTHFSIKSLPIPNGFRRLSMRKTLPFGDLEASHVDSDMTGFVCRKLAVLLLVDLDKGHFGGVRETSERHSRGIFSFI